jgi:hypothetical protein
MHVQLLCHPDLFLICMCDCDATICKLTVDTFFNHVGMNAA